MATHKDALMAYTGKLTPIQLSRLEKDKKAAQSKPTAQSRQQQALPNAAAISSARRGAFRVKIPILSPPAFMRSAPIGPLPVRPNAPVKSAAIIGPMHYLGLLKLGPMPNSIMLLLVQVQVSQHNLWCPKKS
ncbi:hypothetical protein PIB30_062345 [Stylosanthes scabra]|uniref:Uncharacterized protein n=1 Tax=Stylosanthes scabra TaxID=79078 RepID=A0ABU6XLW6_9FABA|nr:hypothetical protein [Stylosanthes scabra]